MVTRAATGLALAAAIGVPVATAQSAPRRPVRVAIPSKFPTPEARALVVRYAAPDEGDVIVLNDAGLTTESFHAALALLRHLRKSAPAPEQDVVATVKGFAPLRADSRLLSRLAALLAQLRSRPLVRIGNLGQGRWLELSDAALST
ncbi:MAG: hypothetical protein ABR499_12530 [Gemmatimonadaceae bacterium]